MKRAFQVVFRFNDGGCEHFSWKPYFRVTHYDFMCGWFWFKINITWWTER